MFVDSDHLMLQYSGRIDWDNSAEPVLVYAASYVKMRFKGRYLKAEVENIRSCWTNYMGVLLDGEQSKIALKNEKGRKSYALAENLSDEVHEVIFFKRQDACHQIVFFGFEISDDGEVLELEKRPHRRIEVFGDSVSCGEVSEALDYVGKEDPIHDGEYSNSWYSYAWIAARKLQAQLHDTSQGGIALLDQTGWFRAPDYLGVESCFDKIQYNPELGKTKVWDFARYQPHVVIVAIGQNDSHPDDYMAENYYCEKAVFWRTHYEQFIRRLMEVYPKAQIILQTTLLKHDSGWDLAIDEVCKRIKSHRVHHFLYKRNGCGTPGHLRIPEAEEMAEELSCYIEAMGEEIWGDETDEI